MNRTVLILLLSLIPFVGVDAQLAPAKMPDYPMKTVNKTVISTHAVGHDIETTNMYEQVYTTKTRVNSNTFSAVPTMHVNTIRRAVSNVQPAVATEPASASAGPSKIRGQQRAVDEGDEKPDGWQDPMTPVGDIPWLLMLVLAAFCAVRRRKAAEL